VNACPAFRLGNCKAGSACFDAHDRGRRNPYIAPDTFLYGARMCKFIAAGSPCRMGEMCSFAHSGLEIRYHPSVFRTKVCPLSVCTGALCPFAHGDVRLSSVECPRTKKTALHGDNGLRFDVRHVMLNYKTKPCTFRGGRLCECHGFAYHNAKERRRPHFWKYLGTPCAKVWREKEWAANPDLLCTASCAFAHTRFEAMFHPMNYKTQPCSAFEARGWCAFGTLCAHAHGLLDLRVPMAPF
jgi:hypothetical protein